MCRNFARKSGRPVIGDDIVPARLAECAETGVEVAASVADVANRAGVVFICVPGAPQVGDVCLGAGGLVEHMRAGQTVAHMTTATVEVDREAAAALARKVADFAGRPGGAWGAGGGERLVLVSRSHGHAV